MDKNSMMDWLQQAVAQAPEEAVGWFDQATEAAAVPLKTSVSAVTKKAVTHDPMPLSSSEEDEEVKRAQEEIVSPLRMSELPARPAFMEEKQLTGAERGTLMHRALSLLPLEKMRGAGNIDLAVREALHELLAREVFTAQELMLLDERKLASFYRSELGNRMLRSPCVRREWGFNLLMDDQRGTILQGVIDCAFREGEGWVLVDYKTDRIADEDAFCQRYAMQLEWYARALERITGTPVGEMWLYAIGIGRAFLINRQE